MAGITHLGVSLAVKRVAPRVPLAVLALAAYTIDIIWALFYFTGVEHIPEPGSTATNPWSHGLFMAVVWSVLAALITALASRDRRTSLIIGLLVFSHWVVDFISHPMTAVFPGDTGLPIFFEGSPVIGLGMWSTQLGANLGEYVPLLLGLGIYLLALRKIRNERRAAASA